MQILKMLKNKLNLDLEQKMDSPVSQRSEIENQSGFTILECILAVGILSAVLASLIGLQTSILYITQTGINNLQAVWAMKQSSAQINYVLSASSLNGFKEASLFDWGKDKSFHVSLLKQDLKDVKASQFFISALKFYNLTNPSSNGNEDVEKTMAPIAQFLDAVPPTPPTNALENKSNVASVNQSLFINVFIQIDWLQGSEKKSFSDGFFLIDNNALSNLKLPNLNQTPESSTGGQKK